MITHEHALKNGTVLNNYIIIKILGAGGFGITYLARDKQLGMEVVIKEYFPSDLAIRKNDSTIISKSSNTEHDFTKGMQRFEEEAQTLAKFNHPSIVKILGYFEANNTAYFVMEYEKGIDLAQYMKQKGEAFSQDKILTIIMPILEGLKEVHRHNYLHRDIKPGNILLRSNKSPVLIDFGASKLAIGEASKSITSMLTEGYAPLEQYNTDIKQQGAFTDIYAVAAVIYKMITGEVPPSAQTRSYNLLQDDKDPFKPLIRMNLAGYDKSFLKAIDRALAIKAKDRPQSVQEFQADIAGILQHGKNKNIVKYISIIIFLLLLILGGDFYIQQGNDKPSEVIVKPVVKKVKDTGQEELIKAKKELEKLRRKNEKEARQRKAEKKHFEQEEKEQQIKKLEKEKQEKLALEKQQKEEAQKEKERLGKQQDVEIKYAQQILEEETFDIETQCKSGDLKKCVDLGLMYELGNKVTKNLKKARELYSKACDYGEPKGCSYLGVMYKEGNGVNQSDVKANKLFKKSCKAGASEWCSYLLGIQKKYPLNIDVSPYDSIDIYVDPSKKKNYNITLKNKLGKKETFDIETQCKSGNLKKCVDLGLMYELGNKVTKNLKKARELYSKACDYGEPKGCSYLGVMYKEGNGVNQSDVKANKLFKKSCKAGASEWCQYLKDRGK